VGLKRRARGSSAGSLAGVGSRARARARAETGVETTGTGVETTGTGVETTGTGAEVEAAGGSLAAVSLAAVSPAAVALGSVPVGGSMLIPTNEQITASGCSKCPRDRDQLEMRNRSGLGSSLSTVILQRTKEGRLRSRQVDLPFGHLEPR
jgi:hypothetical protein